MNMLSKEEINKVYQNIQKNLTSEQIEFCKLLLEKTIKNISNVIGQYVDIHKKIYNSNETYCKFINNVLTDIQYNKLLSIGESQKYLNTANNIRSFGLFGLTRKIFGVDNKNTEKKFTAYLSEIEIFLDCFNDSMETGDNFILYFLTVLYLKNRTLNAFKSYAEEINF